MSEVKEEYRNIILAFENYSDNESESSDFSDGISIITNAIEDKEKEFFYAGYKKGILNQTQVMKQMAEALEDAIKRCPTNRIYTDCTGCSKCDWFNAMQAYKNLKEN